MEADCGHFFASSATLRVGTFLLARRRSAWGAPPTLVRFFRAGEPASHVSYVGQ
jgi:hypothetical protein